MLISAPAPKMMPSRLTRNTRPLASMVPRICEGPWPPVTRLRVIEVAFGCTNCVRSPVPMLNVCQLTIAFWLDWLTVTWDVPWPLMVAEPPTTWPPCGLAAAGDERQRQQRRGRQEESADAHGLPQYFAPRMTKARQSLRGPSTAFASDTSAV